jgi:hypothetical protein
MIKRLDIGRAPKLGLAEARQLTLAVFDTLLPREEEPPMGTGDAFSLANVLLGSRKTRHGPAATPEQAMHLADMVQAFMSEGRPIHLLVPYGAAKGYGVFPGRLEADLADLLMLQRLERIHRQISRTYRPGIEVTLFVEDIAERMLTTNKAGLAKSSEVYSRSLHRLAQLVTVPVEFTCETGRLVERGYTRGGGREGAGLADVEGYRLRALGYASKFEAYWRESENTAEEQWDKLATYLDLASEGWSGVLPREYRDFQLARAEAEVRAAGWGSGEDAIRRRVCLYLGVVLARKRCGLTRFDIRPPVAAFFPYPPGTDPKLSLGRIEYKLKDARNSNCRLPPWVGYGCVKRPTPTKFEAGMACGEFEPKLLGLREYKARAEGREPFSLVVEGDGGVAAELESELVVS